jgi:nucleoside-triphosphatase THEP1
MPDENTISKQAELTADPIDELVLTEYPYPIAANYRRILEATDWEHRTRECIDVFGYGMRAMALGILSQYLIRDRDEFSDPVLNRELYKQKLSNISLGTWVNYLFLALQAYRGRRDLFFMQELYDLYWDTSRTPHRSRKGVKASFQRLVEIRNQINHQRAPKDETGWEKLGRETLEHLREIMKRFSFLKNYDLIRVVKSNKGGYEYERYTGQKITHRKSLEGTQDVEPGWFYLSRGDHNLLSLHPLLILWTSRDDENWIEGAKLELDVAVLDELMKNVVSYFATVVREILEKSDETLIAQLRDLIEKARQQVGLSWKAIQEATQKVSSEEMENAQKKYNQALYLQREKIFEKFQDFLASQKAGFVLTGKSGVGKSNFVLSLAEVLASEENVTVMMYNAARLDVSSLGMAQKISQDLGKFVKFGGKANQNVFAEIDKSKVMADKQLLVIFDAINENTSPREVLYKIDQMVGTERYSWLKVLITSRPEGWRTMKKGLPLAEERYYREQGSSDVSFELEEFTVKLDIFERDELKEVYDKYRHVFNLRTEYSALEPGVRHALRDPLVLRLVAVIYKDKSIPDHIHVSDIYRMYINHLLESKPLYQKDVDFLEQKDVDFLEQELMPLMLKPGFYENKLTASEVQRALTQDGRPIRELIHNADPIGDGKRVNDSYVRLRDTELLDQSGIGMDYVISFKYERFYEYFGGRRLYQAAREYAENVKR